MSTVNHKENLQRLSFYTEQFSEMVNNLDSANDRGEMSPHLLNEQRETMGVFLQNMQQILGEMGSTEHATFQIGDKVSFGRENGERTTAVVLKVNRKTLKVKTLEGRGRYSEGMLFRVSPVLCTKIT